MTSAPEKVSFTVRRPSPISRADSGTESDTLPTFKKPALPRHLANGSTPGSPLGRSAASSPGPDTHRWHSGDTSSEDEYDEEIKDELVTGFDRFGVQRSGKDNKPKASSPLVIPALQNRDWREVARKRKNPNQFVPNSGRAQTGADGSVGGLGTRDTINSGPVLSGLQKKTRIVKEEEGQGTDGILVVEESEDVKMEVEEEDEDKRALRAILAGANGLEETGPGIDIIPAVTEDDAFKQDVVDLPESASLADYERVPVSQFGAALLRGMGWKEGTAASRKPGKGMVEPYIPQARPALLGIGAKEQEVLDDGSKNGRTNKRPEKRYVPVVRAEREGDSRKRERSRSPTSRRESRRSSRERGSDRGGERDDRRIESSRRDRERDRDSTRDRDRGYKKDEYRKDDRRERDKYRDRDYDRDRRRDRSPRDSDRRRRD